MNFSVREKKVLAHAFEHRVLSITNLRDIFLPGLAMKTAYKYLDWITKKHPEILTKKLVESAGEIALIAKPSPGLASTYPDHDYIISRIRLSLEGSLEDDTWISESIFRIRGYGEGPESSDRASIPRIPDALWCIREERLKFVAIEFERTPKTIARMSELIRVYENKRNKIDYVLLFAATSQIARSYNNLLNEFQQTLGSNFVPKIRVIDISLLKSELNSEAWLREMRSLALQVLMPNKKPREAAV